MNGNYPDRARKSIQPTWKYVQSTAIFTWGKETFKPGWSEGYLRMKCGCPKMNTDWLILNTGKWIRIVFTNCVHQLGSNNGCSCHRASSSWVSAFQLASALAHFSYHSCSSLSCDLVRSWAYLHVALFLRASESNCGPCPSMQNYFKFGSMSLERPCGCCGVLSKASMPPLLHPSHVGSFRTRACLVSQTVVYALALEVCLFSLHHLRLVSFQGFFISIVRFRDNAQSFHLCFLGWSLKEYPALRTLWQ